MKNKREIKFRAKRLDNGKWAYGYPMHNEFTEKWYIFPPQGMTGTTGVEVDPETIGQFTGCKDDQGTEIYEGDIVKHEIGDITATAPVEWIGTGFQLLCDDNFYIGVPLYQFVPEEYMEIVGNKYNKTIQ